MKISCFLAVIAIFTSAISQAQPPTVNPLYSHLPQKADHVYSIRLGQIIAKGNLEPLLNNIPPSSKDPKAALAMSVIKDPTGAGIDLNHEILVAQTSASVTGADTINYTEILVPLTDSAKFRTALTGAIKDLHIHRVPGKGATTYQKKMGMAWNDRLLVITEASAQPLKIGEQCVEKSLSALTGFSGTPWLTDPRFIAGFSTDEDLHAWSTKMEFGKALTKMLQKMAARHHEMPDQPMPGFNTPESMQHPPVLSTFNFANGRIILKSTTFRKPDDAAAFRRVADRHIDKDLLARVPAGLLLGAGIMHLNMSAVPDLLDKYHARQRVDSMLGKKGLALTDITSALGGDFMLAALADTTASTDTTKKRLNIYFVATLGDPAKLMQLAAKASANPGAMTDTAQMAKMKKLMDKMVIRDNMLVISGSKEMAQNYFSNADRRSTALLDDSKGMQTAVIDLKAVSAFIMSTMSNNPKAMLAARVFEKLDRIQIDNGILEGDNTVLTFQIITGDSSTNSLATLVGLLH